MSTNTQPTIFVSSTCYDLAQARESIELFAATSGLKAILSEYDSFPVSPVKGNVENCLNTVREHADLFVLVIGSRYGNPTDTGRTVTNLEYLEAKTCGVPCYVFIKQNIVDSYPVWKKNRNADFSPVVETNEVFAFVEEIYASNNQWVYPFARVEDVTSTLRTQLGYLFHECLGIYQKFLKTDSVIYKLKPESLRLYVQKPFGWPYLVITKYTSELLAEHDSKRFDIDLGMSNLTIGQVAVRDLFGVIAYIQSKLQSNSIIVKQIVKLMNEGFPKATGCENGTPDINRIIHYCETLSNLYEKLLEWTIEFNNVVVDDKYRVLMSSVQKFSSQIISDVPQFFSNAYTTLCNQIKDHKPGESINLNLTLEFVIPEALPDEYGLELKRLVDREFPGGLGNNS